MYALLACLPSSFFRIRRFRATARCDASVYRVLQRLYADMTKRDNIPPTVLTLKIMLHGCNQLGTKSSLSMMFVAEALGSIRYDGGMCSSSDRGKHGAR